MRNGRRERGMEHGKRQVINAGWPAKLPGVELTQQRLRLSPIHTGKWRRGDLRRPYGLTASAANSSRAGERGRCESACRVRMPVLDWRRARRASRQTIGAA